MAQRRPLGYDLPDWVRFGLASGCSQRQGLAIFRRAGGQVRTYEWGVVWRQEQARMDKTGRLPRP